MEPNDYENAYCPKCGSGDIVLEDMDSTSAECEDCGHEFDVGQSE